ncbi:MAG: DNA repair exonuclease [Acidaminobacteraceae bacterium]
MIKILHLGDIHLGYSYRSKNSALRSLLEGSIEKSFQRALEFSINNEIDLVIIAGDLFDFGPIGPKTFDFFIALVRKLRSKGIEVIYVLGNHDNLTLIQDNVMKTFREEMIIIDKAGVSEINLKSKDGDLYNVYGVGHEFEKMNENLIKNYPCAKDDTSYNIGVAHCFVESAISSSGYDKYLPTTYEDLISKNYNYFALGHIHLPSVYKDTNIAYCGSLQALSFKEDGERGGNYVEIDKYGTSIKHMNFSSKLYKTVEVKIGSEDKDHVDLIEHIKTEVKRELKDYNFKNTLLRINLSGHVSSTLMNLLENEIEYISEQLNMSIESDYLLIKIDDVSLDYKSEDVVNQRHFLSYMLSKFDEDTDRVANDLISNLSKNGVDISKIDIVKCVEEIRESMLQSLIKR